LSRAARLLDLIQLFRAQRRPVSGANLAQSLGISLRTLYRDIETLKAQGADIEGEAGIGYIMRAGFMLPPMMFTRDEIEALVLGSSWVSDRAGGALGAAARQALTKIAAVLPPDLRNEFDTSALMIGPGEPLLTGSVDLTVIRDAIRREYKLQIGYTDTVNTLTQRIIWPVALAFFDQVRIVVAWCELRDGFRHFRADRIAGLSLIETRYPGRRTTLLKSWRNAQGIAQP
jgi:predicted DNA-binding transcriptional regulator YafY